jgi:hypothetical protein
VLGFGTQQRAILLSWITFSIVSLWFWFIVYFS